MSDNFARRPTQTDLDQLNHWVTQVRFVDAWHYAKDLAPLEAWTDPGARGLAGRLASYWGDPELGRRIHRAYFRAFPQDPVAITFAALDRCRRHGPFEGWLFLQDKTPAIGGSEAGEAVARLWSSKAQFLAEFHDFEAALYWSDAACELSDCDPWIRVDRSHIREKQDNYQGALDEVEAALQISPIYRAALEQKAHLLRLLNRDDESRDILVGALQNTQNCYAAQILVTLENEMNRHHEAGLALDLVERYLPMPDASRRQWIQQMRAGVAYHLGRYDEAIRHASAVKNNKYFSNLAESLARPLPAQKRVVLGVGFVRQHHQTCAPATMSAIGAYWETPMDHLAVAEVITYDGTPDHEERHWVEANGWVSREFRVTWESAVALLDRGCPFTLTTVYTRSAHLQAVLGYDERMRTLIIRDPYWPNQSEMLADDFLTGAAASGPRGHVFVPAAKAALLADVVLPDEKQYDLYYRVRRALAEHRRSDAEQVVDTLHQIDAGHILTLWARRELASYDGNPRVALECAQSLLRHYPLSANYQLDEIANLRQLGRSDELREKLESYSRRPGVDPLLWRDAVEESRKDARRMGHNLRLTRRLLHRRPADGECLRLQAHLLWQKADFSGATDVYRLAACADDAKGHHWESYSIAARLAGRTEECLQLLRARFRRMAERSGVPARNLIDALIKSGRHTEAQTVFNEALALRPRDGSLMLFGALQHALRGEYADCGSLLEKSRPLVHRGSWLRTNAQVAAYELDYTRALALWREVASLNPVDEEAHGHVARLIATLQGTGAAVDYLEAEWHRQPNFLPLLRLQLEWLRQGNPVRALEVLEQYLGRAAGDPWGWREKAVLLAKLARHEAALEAARHALLLEANSVYTQGVLAATLQKQGRVEEAKQTFMTAVRLHVEADWLFAPLLQCGGNGIERRKILDFIRDEMHRQHVVGDAATRLPGVARGILKPEELTEWLLAIEVRHPGEWQVRVARTLHSRERGEQVEALALARDALTRFQAVPEIWLELASCCALSLDTAGELAALEHAHRLQPNAADPILRLASVHEKNLRMDQAAEILAHGVRANPLDPVLHARLSAIRWKQGRKDEALAGMERALTFSPLFEWAWSNLHDWHKDLGRPQATIEQARRLAAARPGDAEPWIQLARLLMWQNQLGAANAAAEEAIKLDPFRQNAHDLRAEALARLGCFDEAIAACRPATWAGPLPRELLGRLAWIEAQRGHHAEAVALMGSLLADQPDYYWGWTMLAEWHDHRQERKECLIAARRMIELAPASPHGWSYLAKTEMAAGHRKEAKLGYAEAVKRDPSYWFGAYQLFQMQLVDREIEAVELSLVAIRTHFSPEQALRCQAEFSAIQRDRAGALKIIGQLVTVAAHHSYLLSAAVQAALKAGWAEQVDELLCEKLADPATCPTAGGLWVQSWIDR